MVTKNFLAYYIMGLPVMIMTLYCGEYHIFKYAFFTLQQTVRQMYRVLCKDGTMEGFDLDAK